MSKVKLEETENQRRLHIGSFFTDLNESDYQELVRIFSQSSQGKTVTAEYLFTKDGLIAMINQMLADENIKYHYVRAWLDENLHSHISQFKQVEQTVGEETEITPELLIERGYRKNEFRGQYEKQLTEQITLWFSTNDSRPLHCLITVSAQEYSDDGTYGTTVIPYCNTIQQLESIENVLLGKYPHLTRLKSDGSEAVEFAEFILDNEFIKQSDGIQRWWGKRIGEENYSTQELYTLFKDEQQLKGK